jgi:hypothetical protein
MQTAMQELIDKLSNYDSEMIYIFKDEIKHLLDKEKEQIIEAINAWCSDDNILTPEQYYNQTYNQKEI